MNSTRSSTPSHATLFAEGLAARGERHFPALALPAIVLVALLVLVPRPGLAILALAGAAIGYVMVRSGFGFASGYRRLFLHGDARPVQAQLLLLAVATPLFAPAFAGGELLGHAVSPTVMPLGIPLATGALMFGVGMQLAGGCGSGSLTALGSGNGRMLVVLFFFVTGSFAASLHFAWWDRLPAVAGAALGESWGWGRAALAQLCLIAAIAVAIGGGKTAPGKGGDLNSPAAATGRWKPRIELGPRAIVMAAIGGLLMGYGSRIAYGCNIGAFLAGVASTSLHGWAWIACAIPGNLLGIWLRSRLDGDVSSDHSR